MKTKEIKFPYYTGNSALGLEPSEGTWSGDVFTSVGGVEWYLHDETADLSDGNGVVWLFDHTK